RSASVNTQSPRRRETQVCFFHDSGETRTIRPTLPNCQCNVFPTSLVNPAPACPPLMGRHSEHRPRAVGNPAHSPLEKRCPLIDLNRIRPERIVEYAQKYIIGQEPLLWAMARAVHHNQRRKGLEDAGYDLRLLPPKKNVLVAGPTGTGKT